MWLILAGAVAFGNPIPCETGAHLPELLQRFSEMPVQYRFGISNEEALIERDAWGDIPHMRTSERFALKWGSDVSIPDGMADALLESLETVRDIEVLQWDMPDPTGVDGTLFNVYVGSTGPEVPEIGGGGYYTWDPADYPMIVVDQSAIDDPEYGSTLVAHEFYHAVQGATDAYWEHDLSGWYWEATAEWATGEVWPGLPGYAVFLGGYALAPHFGLHHYQNDGSYIAPDLHQYGAFIFTRYISEYLDGLDIVNESWRSGQDDDDPITVLDALFGEESVGAIFADHAAHNTTWDYVDGGTYIQTVRNSIDYTPEANVLDFVEGEEEPDGWRVLDSEHYPQRYGYNIIRVPSTRIDNGLLVVGFQGEEEGTYGTLPIWELRVVLQRETSIEYRTIEIDDGTVMEAMAIDDGVLAAWLVVANISDRYLSFPERFHYKYRFTDPSYVPLGDEEDTGVYPGAHGECSCGTGSKPYSLLGFLVLCVGFWTRSRFRWSLR